MNGVNTLENNAFSVHENFTNFSMTLRLKLKKCQQDIGRVLALLLSTITLELRRKISIRNYYRYFKIIIYYNNCNFLQ